MTTDFYLRFLWLPALRVGARQRTDYRTGAMTVEPEPSPVKPRFSACMRACDQHHAVEPPPMRPFFVTLASPLLLLLVNLPALAEAPDGDPKPEIKREAAQPQPQSSVHTLRQIPEACARLEGMFTGQADDPYAFAVVRISPTCQARARFVDAAKAQPSQAKGWKFNDLIRVPNADCPSQQVVVRVWRKPGAAAPPALDAQGRSRIYLEEQKQAAAAGKLAAIPMYAATMTVEGEACR
jgi:hypothetical protein